MAPPTGQKNFWFWLLSRIQIFPWVQIILSLSFIPHIFIEHLIGTRYQNRCYWYNGKQIQTQSLPFDKNIFVMFLYIFFLLPPPSIVKSLLTNKSLAVNMHHVLYLPVARGPMKSPFLFPKCCHSHSPGDKGWRHKRWLILSTDLVAGKKLIPQVQFQGLTGGLRDAPKRDSLLCVSQVIQFFLSYLN